MLTGRKGLRLAVVVAAVAVGLAGATGPVAANPDGWVDCEQLPDHADCDVDAESSGDGGVVAGSGGEVTCRWEGEVVPCRNDWGWFRDGCYYRRVEAEPSGAVRSGAAYAPRCIGDGADVSRPLVWIEDGVAPGPPELGRVAASRLVLPRPVVGLAPELPAAQLVGLPTWWWISEGVWRPRSASASVPGVSVVAVGTPVASVWRAGDGGEVTCEGPGTPYSADAGVALAASPDCGYVYERSSAGQPGGVFSVTVTITWQVSWSGAGMSGTLGPLFSASTVEVPVAEVQTVVVP